MSNKRKLKKRTPPRHECVGEGHDIHFCDPDSCPGDGCPNAEHDLHICCDKGYRDALAAVHGAAIVDCPVCGGRDALDITLGEYWLGEPEKILRCLNGCDPLAIEAVLEDPSLEAYTQGCCPNCRPVRPDGDRLSDEGAGQSGDQPTALYRWWDTENLLLYIGISDELAARVKGHVKASSWMDFAATSAIERHPTRTAALAAEEAAIKAEGPLFNHQHNSSPEAQKRLIEYLIRHNRTDLLTPAVSRG